MGKFSFRIPMPSRGGITPTTHLDKLVQLRLELFEPGLFHFVFLDERGFDRAKLFPFLLKAEVTQMGATRESAGARRRKVLAG